MHKIIIGVFIFLLSADIYANDGYALAKKIKAYDKGWQSMKAVMLMTIIDKKNRKSIRELKVKSLEVEDDGDKSLMIFEKPRDIKGTAFLTHSHISKADDQWLLMPSISRVKRIASENKSGPFMGSEFAYEDMSSFEVSRYDYELLKDEVINNQRYKLLVSKPKDKNSGYSKTISWVNPERYTVFKTEFYDKQGKKIKILKHHDYKLYEDKHWRPDYSVMSNINNGRKTQIDWKGYLFKQSLDESDFTVSKLKRLR